MSSRKQKWLLSGGIGSGKSAVRRDFENLGIPTVDADSIGHDVLAPGGPAFRQVIERWPDVVDNGVIDRRRLAELVFQDRRELTDLEDITHPLIFALLQEKVMKTAGPLIIEIPLLVQPFNETLPRMVVDAPESVRLKRIFGRGIPHQDATNRIAAQPRRSEWLCSADLVVPNTGDLAGLSRAVASVADALGFATG